MERTKSGKNKENTDGGIFTVGNFVSGLENILKNKNKQSFVVILIIIGIVLMMLPRTDGNKAEETSSEEKRLCSILSEMEGVGDVSVVITYYRDEKDRASSAKGAVITAEGAGDIRTKNDISEAVQAALDLPAHKVKVFSKEQK